jgi:hypothetical protein
MTARGLNQIFAGFLCAWLLAGCSQVRQEDISRGAPAGGVVSQGVLDPAPAEQYAGEILAYLMQVVVGQAGNPKLRPEWATRGREVGLDLARIQQLLSDPGQKKDDLLVLDANILGLSQVLYHYNPRLNQFKGQYLFDSVYPSAELLAIRLLLLQKQKTQEKVRMQALVDRERLLIRSGREPGRMDLHATHLRAEEFHLLRDIFRSEPIFSHYYKDPFMVEAFYRIGIVAPDPWVRKTMDRARYRALAADPSALGIHPDVVRVAVIPSFIQEFEYGRSFPAPYVLGFMPSASYREVSAELKRQIKAAIEAQVTPAGQPDPVRCPARDQPDPIGGWAQWLDRHLWFENLDLRPFAIYPENAERMIGQICPKADFVIIILGKDVYRSFSIDPLKDAFPNANLAYLDFADLKYHQAETEIQQMGQFILSKIQNRVCRPVDSDPRN